MEDLRTPLRTTSSPRDEEPLLTISKPSQTLQASPLPAAATTPLASITNLDDVLTVLCSKPSTSTLSRILGHLTLTTAAFDIHTPSPKASQVVKTIIEVTVPDFWNVIPKSERGRLAQCLRSVAGLGGIAARLRFLVKGAESQPGVKGQIEELLDLLQGIMGVKGFLHEIWISGEEAGEARRGVVWKEFVTLVGGGKVLSVAAEAESVLGRGGRERWIGDGKKFTGWLGREIARAGSKIEAAEEGGEWKALAILLSRAFSLGYSDDLVEALTYHHLHLPTSLSKLHYLVSLLQSHDKHTYLTSLLRVLSRKHLASATPHSDFDPKWWLEDAPKISQIAGLLNDVIGSNEDFRDLAVDWLVSPNGGGVGEPIGIRRALVCVLSKGEVVLKGLLEKSLGQFGDKIWIRHTPIMRQEVNVQLLLLSAGYVYRLMPQFLYRLARSSTFLNGVSNRLGTSSTRARFLGMIVGEALSGMTDEDGKAMKFGVEETATEEAKWWKSIKYVEDAVGIVEGLEVVGRELVVRKKKKETRTQTQTQTGKVMAIEEIEDDDDDDEDELMPYPKPDSDAEDSDDDPTLINRKKDTIPVYIRDLLLYLRSTDSYDRQLLALQSGASLIRRKATFGKELSDHATELTSLLTGLNDKFDMDDFQEMRLQALIALVVSLPQLVCGLLARGFFEGDYSLGQRAGMVSAIGMGARELAGMDDTDLPLSEASGKGKRAADMFPSKKLLGKMHDTWGRKPAGPLDRITGSMEKMMISPMAAEAADKVTGPNVLKVRTFSSRIEVEKRRKKPAENKLGVVVGAFFFPLTGRWWGALKDFGGQGVHFEPFLLTIFIKTLAIILHAAGPSAVSLPQMTSELWDLLFSLRHHHSPTSTSTDSSVQEAVLFALLTLLEVNTENDGGRKLTDEHAKELVETQEWVGGILESGVLGEEEKGRVLAASVLMRINGVVEAYQRRLMGELLSLEA